MPTEAEKVMAMPVEWYFPDDIKSRYATNLIIQHDDNEFYLSFFETRPPILIGSAEEQRRELEKLGIVRAECVARIIVAANKMPDFVRALQANLDKYNSRLQDLE